MVKKKQPAGGGKVGEAALTKPDPGRRKLTLAESEAFRAKSILLAPFDVHLGTVFRELSGSDFGAELSLARMNAVLGHGRSDADVTLIEGEEIEEARAVTNRWLPQLHAEMKRIRALPVHPRRLKLLNCLGVVLWKLDRFGNRWVVGQTMGSPDAAVGLPGVLPSGVQEGIRRVLQRSRTPPVRVHLINELALTVAEDIWARVADLPAEGQVGLGLRLAVAEHWDSVISEFFT